MKDLFRKCYKCGASPMNNPAIFLYRFPKPGTRNLCRVEMWAKFCCPDKEFASPEFQKKLYVDHVMLCHKHFERSSFWDYDNKKLLRDAVPSETIPEDDTYAQLVFNPKATSPEAQIAKLEYLRKNAVLDDDESLPLLYSVEPVAGPSQPINNTLNEGCKMAMLEVCIDSLESAINAIHGGADELEVCSSLTEGGLTPSAGLVREIMGMVNNLAARKPIRKSCHDCGCDKLTKRPKVNVMIRCRTGSDFHYSEEEMDTMLSDLTVFKTYGVNRFVFGALTDTQHIDEENCKRLIQQASPTPVTFHRAYDVCVEPLTAVYTIVDLGFDRLLTSGQKSLANEFDAFQLIKALVISVGDKIVIMPGAGVNQHNAKIFISIGCKMVHSSCKRIKILPKIENDLSMGTNDSEHIYVTDENIVRKMKEILVIKDSEKKHGN